ncbi:MAG: response regulator [Proteobacteria bacterium]|nr:response regulator [Pseudomonadota bacterium]
MKKIVLAEDDDAIAHMVNMTLGDAGFLCLRASDGEEALNLVRLHAPDLLVLDVMMPRLDGREVARRIKEDVLLSRTPILMLTALASVDDKVEGIDAGADAYMVKPFDLRELSAQVKALIRASTRERQRNPTTDLPGSGAVEDHILQSLAKNEDIAVAHMTVREFDTYVDQVGFPRAETLIKALGEMILDKVRTHSPEKPFLGHLGGADFIAVVSPDSAERLSEETITVFEKSREQWDRREDDSRAPLCLVIGVADSRGIEKDDAASITGRVAAALKAAKEKDGSSHVIWQKDND